ncbi:MAG: GNAT family N-acetyltransferase [Phycisphaerales bacterium]
MQTDCDSAIEVCRARHRDDHTIAAAMVEAARLAPFDVGENARTWLVRETLETHDAVCMSYVGTASVDVVGDRGIVRGVVIDPNRRGRGIGGQLVETIVGDARARDLRELWLLTMDAGPFFARHGFVGVARSAAPPSVGETELFRAHCPDTAHCMVMPLGDDLSTGG